MSALFDIGYETGQAFAKKHKSKILESREKAPKKVMETLSKAGVDKKVLEVVKRAERRTAPAISEELYKEFQKIVENESDEVIAAVARAADMFEQSPDAPQERTVLT